jgi:hypothetical protein
MGNWAAFNKGTTTTTTNESLWKCFCCLDASNEKDQNQKAEPKATKNNKKRGQRNQLNGRRLKTFL